jgi:hypothetical protein
MPTYSTTKIRDHFQPGELVQWKKYCHNRIVFPNVCDPNDRYGIGKSLRNLDHDFDDMHISGWTIAAYSPVVDMYEPDMLIDLHTLEDYKRNGFSDIEVEKYHDPTIGCNYEPAYLKCYHEESAVDLSRITQFYRSPSGVAPESSPNISLIVLRKHSTAQKFRNIVIDSTAKTYYLCMTNEQRKNRMFWINGEHLEPYNHAPTNLESIKKNILEKIRAKR